jgi:hypothetical protein
MRPALVLVACACAATPRPRLAPPGEEDDPAARAELLAGALEGWRASYVLTWNGARIGEARETFVAMDDAEGGYRFERSERVVVRRGPDAVAVARTVIQVDLDAAMTARRVVVDRSGGASRVRAEAIRQVDNGWRVRYGGNERVTDGAAVPATLVPLLVAARGVSPGPVWDGPILVEGAGLAVAHLDVTVSNGEALAEVRTAAGVLTSRARLDERGFVLEGGVGAALASRRVAERELAADFDPPEVVDSSAVALDGEPDGGFDLQLVVEHVAAPPPVLAELPDQLVTTAADGAWNVAIDPSALPPGAAAREIRERVSHVARALDDDLGTFALTAEDALAAGRGDCTAHAIVLQRDLEDHGYEARLVTGFVVDTGALRRHRWVVVRVGATWVPLDPMYDEAPASARHLALAVHGSAPDELAFVDDVAFAGWSGAVAGYR